MIRAVAPPLPAALAEGLEALTQAVRAEPEPEAQFKRAEALWASRLRSDAPLGKALRALLDAVAPGEGQLCRWCEVSVGDTVDHVAPKRHAPLLAFTYENLLPACGACQSKKGDRWAVMVDGALVHATSAAPPPPGQPALISPRHEHEDPLQFIDLDLELGVFTPVDEEGAPRLRADYTINSVGLNSRATLCQRRQRAFDDYLGWLREAVAAPAGSDARAQAKRKIQHSRLPCVWAHMKRQADQAPVAALFAQLPEALGW